MIKRSLITVLVAVMLINSFGILLCFAQDQSTEGTVTTLSKVNIRVGPGTNHDILKDSDSKSIRLEDGHAVTVLGQKESEDEQNPGFWYNVKFKYNEKEYTGYIYSIYVNITPATPDIEYSEDFEEFLKSVPESYRDPLRVLHTNHPTWQFKILNTGLDFQTAVDNECVYGRSLTSSTILSQRSTDPSCYNWLTDTYTAIEGSKWFQASEETIKYYMDPRNFLTEENVFQFEALSYEKSTQTQSGVEKILSGSFMDGVKISDGSSRITYAQTYMKAAALSNVSPYHLAARTIQEVGKKGGKGTTGTTSGYEGIYNFYNIGATTGVMAGLKYAKTGGSLSSESKAKYMLPWNSQYKAIVGGAIFIGENYINKGQNTLYLEKFDVEPTNGLYWHQYMANVSAAYSEGRNIYFTYKAMGLLESPLTFIIPVFENMPKEKCPLPTKDGSINNHLSSLEVEGMTLTPTFSHDVNTYSIVLDEETLSGLKTVNIKATQVTELATVSGNVGEQELKEGLNTFTISVCAENGDMNYYTVYIAGSQDLIPDTPPEIPDEPQPPEPPKPQSKFTLDLPHNSWLIWGIEKGKTLEWLIPHLNLEGEARVEFSFEEKPIDSNSAITTNQLVTIYCDGKKSNYKTIIYGDVDCDGEITVIDLLMVRRSILGSYQLDSAMKVAADCDKDSKISAIDLLMIRRSILGSYDILQS